MSDTLRDGCVFTFGSDRAKSIDDRSARDEVCPSSAGQGEGRSGLRARARVALAMHRRRPGGGGGRRRPHCASRACFDEAPRRPGARPIAPSPPGRPSARCVCRRPHAHRSGTPISRRANPCGRCADTLQCRLPDGDHRRKGCLPGLCAWNVCQGVGVGNCIVRARTCQECDCVIANQDQVERNRHRPAVALAFH